MTDIDTSPEAVEWTREIWAEERGEFMHEGVHVYHPAATVPRWEGDRPGPYHKYIDVDIYDSSEKYHAARYNTLDFERNALRAQLATAQAQVQTARECIGYFADGDNWLRDGKLDPNSGNFTGTIYARAALALIQPTEPRPDAAKEE